MRSKRTHHVDQITSDDFSHANGKLPLVEADWQYGDDERRSRRKGGNVMDGAVFQLVAPQIPEALDALVGFSDLVMCMKVEEVCEQAVSSRVRRGVFGANGEGTEDICFEGDGS